MTISDELVQAYVDGELAPDDAARVRAAIAADVLVAARVERARALKATLRDAFDPVLDEPVPPRLSALLARPGEDDTRPGVAPRSMRAGERTARWRRPLVALAATVAALAIASWLRMPSADMAVSDGALLARGDLARRLDRGLASAPDAASDVSIGLTFRAVDGRICRSFVAASARLAGVACRERSGWALSVVSRIDPEAPGDLRQASSAVPAEVQAAIDARMQGDAFDAAQERRARDAGWH
jgi:anti-sigma-K factor RskA